MGDNKLLSEFVIICHRSQVKSCDCETCKLKVELYERDKTNGIRENVSGAFIFCEEAL